MAIEIVSFPIKNCDFPIKNCDFPIKNGDFPIKNGGSFPLKMVIFHLVTSLTSLIFSNGPVIDSNKSNDLLGGEVHDCNEASVASHLWKNNAVRLCIPYMHI